MLEKNVALISDIHANIEALYAVLSDIENQGVENIICLGDLIGYGPNPRETLKEAVRWLLVLKGNHEEGLLFSTMYFNQDAAKAINWTRNQINSQSFPKEENRSIWNFLDAIPEVKEEDNAMFVHASPRDHTKEYVMPFDVNNEESMKDLFSKFKQLCFCGHTHIPGVFTENFEFLPPKAIDYKLKLTNNSKYLINTGSVGQPRNRDIRASYVILRPDLVEFRCVEYDYRKTMGKIEATKEIPLRFAERLALGK